MQTFFLQIRLLLFSSAQTFTANTLTILVDLLRRIVKITPPLCRVKDHLTDYVDTVALLIRKAFDFCKPSEADGDGSHLVNSLGNFLDSGDLARWRYVHDDFVLFVKNHDGMSCEVDYLQFQTVQLT